MPRYKYYPTPEVVEEFSKNLSANMEQLKLGYEFLEDQPDDKAKAKSFISYYEKYDTLSSKQLWSAARMLMEIEDVQGVENKLQQTGGVGRRIDRSQYELEKALQESTPTLVVDQVAGLRLISMFDKAMETRKYPSVRLPSLTDEKAYGQGGEIQFYRTGDRAKNPGTINITNGKSKEDWVLFANINRSGATIFASLLYGKPDLQLIIKNLVENFVTEAKIRGRQTSNCCFCGLGLENKISVYHGYGPICAENWGLPWEGKSEEEVERETLEKLGGSL